MQLLVIIRKYIRPENEVISDSWRAYNRLSSEGYIHYQVNHQRHFVHPGSGAHTQHSERAWQSFPPVSTDTDTGEIQGKPDT